MKVTVGDIISVKSGDRIGIFHFVKVPDSRDQDAVKACREYDPADLPIEIIERDPELPPGMP